MSGESSEMDVQGAHRHFAVEGFNSAWALIEKADRSAAEDEAMVLCAMASLWHWTQRVDCADRNLSIGHWQVSRVLALVERGEEAMRYGRAALRYAEGAGAFYVGYAHEAMARAALGMGDGDFFREELGKARACAERVMDGDERSTLKGDLGELEGAEGRGGLGPPAK